ncbi:MAG TPA: hypothetical protein VJH70_02465 [Candidatus Paceibacterota bacterium]
MYYWSCVGVLILSLIIAKIVLHTSWFGQWLTRKRFIIEERPLILKEEWFKRFGNPEEWVPESFQSCVEIVDKSFIRYFYKDFQDKPQVGTRSYTHSYFFSPKDGEMNKIRTYKPNPNRFIRLLLKICHGRMPEESLQNFFVNKAMIKTF